MSAKKQARRRKIETLKRKGDVSVEAGIRIRQVRPEYFMVDYRKGDFIRRKCFNTEVAARTYCQQVSNEVINRGIEAFKLTDSQRLEAVKAFELLKGSSASLADAVREYLQRHPPAGSETVATCKDRYLADMEKDDARPLAIKDKRLKLEMFCRDMEGAVANGDRPMVEIGDIEIRRWIDAKGFTKPTARAYTGALKTLVNFFHDRKRKRIRQRGKTPTTWPLSIVRALFNKAAAIEPDAVPALVLLFQCGVRPHEVLRSTWKMIDLKARLVRLPAEVTKTGEARQVTIPDNAVEWLAPYIGKATDKLVAGATHGNSETALNRWRRNLMLALKIED